MSDVSLDEIVSLCKRRGFIYQGSEIYGGLAGTWDYGPLGVALKRNIMQLWWKTFVEDRDDMFGVDAAILMNKKVWEASGHVATFADPLVECTECHIRMRADKIVDMEAAKAYVVEHTAAESAEDFQSQTMSIYLSPAFKEYLNESVVCPSCGQKHKWGDVRMFNMMFKTQIGPVADENSVSYLRPETAQGIFTNFKNVVDSFYPDVPFGIGQQGKAFRNEISPRDFIFRDRELEQMEIEYFVRPEQWEEAFEMWRKQMWAWCESIGLATDNIHELEVPDEDRAHYSKRTIDFEYDFPIGKEELYGLAYRTDFDLTNIQRASSKSMEYRPKDGSAPFVPHVIEPTFGVERTIMAVLTAAYTVDEVNGEKRSFLKLPAHLAPVKVAVSPLLKNKPELVAKAGEVYQMLKKEFGAVMWDDNGNIGKRYRRQDEIGTPYCVTIDFQTLEDDTVTVRNRDTTEQERRRINLLSQLLTD
jgi:glycyl-tRNA synthetase